MQILQISNRRAPEITAIYPLSVTASLSSPPRFLICLKMTNLTAFSILLQLTEILTTLSLTQSTTSRTLPRLTPKTSRYPKPGAAVPQAAANAPAIGERHRDEAVARMRGAGGNLMSRAMCCNSNSATI